MTADPEPLAAFGHGASNAVAELLEAAGVRVHTNSRAEVPESRKVVVQPEGRELNPGRIVAMPRLLGPGIRNVPADHDGFIPIDEHCRVRGLEPRVFAAGDAANLQIKHGGLGAQMADTVAAGIAGLAGAEVQVEPLRAGAGGVLYTGAEPLYLTARIEDGRVESEVSATVPGPPTRRSLRRSSAPFLHSLD